MSKRREEESKERGRINDACAMQVMMMSMVVVVIKITNAVVKL